VKTERVYLKPGELFTAERPTLITTVLGSCVAITMFVERLGVGSICHAMLPRNPPSNAIDTFRYVDSSILYMIEDLGAAGVKRNEIEVKLLGGADVLDRVEGSPASVGQQNIKEAMDIIRKEKLELAACDVGGESGRKIVFYAHTGRVLLKRINKKPPGDVGVWSRAKEYLFLAQRVKGYRKAE
jgi:chemotaxis protein CheD